MTGWPTASSTLAWKRSCSTSCFATICTSIKSAKQKPTTTVCGSSRLRHWLHSSEAPKYGSELLSLYPAAGFCIYVILPHRTGTQAREQLFRWSLRGVRDGLAQQCADCSI